MASLKDKSTIQLKQSRRLLMTSREGLYRHQGDLIKGSEVPLWFDDLPTLKQPAIDIPLLAIDQNKAANYVRAQSFHDAPIDDFRIEEQATWMIPVLHTSDKTLRLQARGAKAENHTWLIRNLVKSSGIYALCSMASPLISIILAPFLTHNLSHAEYGALSVLNTSIALLAGVTQLGLNTAFFRSYSYDYESQEDRKGVLSTVVVLLSLSSLCITLIMLLTAPWLSALLFASSSFSDAVKVTALVVLIQNLTVPGFAWLRAENRALFFSLSSIANLVISLGANIVFVGMLHMGIVGSLVASGSGFAVVVFCTLPAILQRVGLRLRFDIARGLLSFGLPSVFTFISVWVLQLSDRFLLVRLGSLVQTASYAVACSLGGVLSAVVLSPFTLAWPSTMFSIAKKDDAATTFCLVFRWYSTILLFAAFGLSIMSTILLALFFPPSYQSAAPIIPIIATSIIFYGVYITFMTGTFIRRKTWYAVVFTTTAALANVGINIILIPLYGSMGAAVSTLIAYMLLALIGYVVNQRIYPVPYEISLFVIELFIGVTLYTGSGLLAQKAGRYEVWGIYIGALALYGSSLAILGKLSERSQKNKIRNTIESGSIKQREEIND